MRNGNTLEEMASFGDPIHLVLTKALAGQNPWQLLGIPIAPINPGHGLRMLNLIGFVRATGSGF